MAKIRVDPQNYFLNENHELPLGEKGGGGVTPKFVGINWTQRANKLSKSLGDVERLNKASKDPLKNRHYYLVADPVSEIIRVSEAKDAKNGQKTEKVEFAGEQSKVFSRLGLELIEVHANGSATVHAAPERMEQLRTRSAGLAGLGARDQARWVSIDDFRWIPANLKFDEEWLSSTDAGPMEVYVKLQPLITEIETDLVIPAITLRLRDFEGLSLKSVGRSYLGRYYLRAVLNRRIVKALASEFTSIQSLHPPILALTNDLPVDIGDGTRVDRVQPRAARGLPCIGVVDTAIPEAHPWLQSYRRATVRGIGCSDTESDHHGSRVASRIVFGHVEVGTTAPPRGTCSFLEVRVSSGRNHVLMESVVGALQSAIVRAPDVRVFNLSFDAESRLDDLLPRQRAETLKHIEELDNFAFDQDILLVIAAGNAASGVVPNPAYPHHFDDPGWELHSIPRAFNALTCGGSIYRLRAGGLASEVDAPCPFTRVGPGFARSPKPDFCAAAGNTDRNYTPQSGSGVWALSALGEPQEVFGTSYAAPLLAREGAFVFRALQQVCPENTRPFACTAKAVLALTADDVGARCDTTLQPLIKRTLGYGKANVATFRNPVSERARFFWQGLVEHHADVVRVQLPIPKDWVNEADSPELRICVAWDTPVCAAAEAQWSCRDVELTLRPNADGASLRGTHSRVPGYPLFNRSWSLLKAKGPLPDLWTVEIKYTQLATYAAGHIVSDSQRVAFAAEIWDASEEPVQPHSYVQSLPIASTFSRFSSTATWLPQAVTVTTDF